MRSKRDGGDAARGGDGICADRKTEVRQRLPTCLIQSRDKSVGTQGSRNMTHSGSMIQQENERRSHLKPEGHHSRSLLAVVQCSFGDLTNVPSVHDPETS